MSYPVCAECGGRMWRDRCHRSRCPGNAERVLAQRARYVRQNVAAFDGEVMMLTVTGPGRDRLADRDAWQWNLGAYGQWKRLRENANKSAHHHVKGQRSGLLAYVPEQQGRGVLHFHVILGAGTVLERRWCEAFARFVYQNGASYGFGRKAGIHRGKWGGTRAAAGYVSKLASYIGKGGSLAPLWVDGTLPGRAFYVATRLTSQTGCTVRMLRRRAFAYYRSRVSVPLGKMREWREYERALGRELVGSELRALVDGVPRATAP